MASAHTSRFCQRSCAAAKAALLLLTVTSLTCARTNGDDLTGYRIVCSDNTAESDYVTSGWFVSPTTAYKSVSGASPASDSHTVSGLTPGTTYECVLSSENGVGGYTTPLVPVHAYRGDETVFDATFTAFETLPDYPDAISNPTCKVILDPVTDPGASSVGSSGAPESSTPALWIQLTWEGQRPNLATRNTLGSMVRAASEREIATIAAVPLPAAIASAATATAATMIAAVCDPLLLVRPAMYECGQRPICDPSASPTRACCPVRVHSTTRSAHSSTTSTSPAPPTTCPSSI